MIEMLLDMSLVVVFYKGKGTIFSHIREERHQKSAILVTFWGIFVTKRRFYICFCI